MCLITTKNIPEIAQKDIVCYKFYILHKVYPPYEDAVLLSPYQDSPAPTINKVTNTLLDRAYLSNYRATYIISRGFHSFKYLDDLINELDFWQSFDIKIFRCIIPKGTKYYEGKFGDFPSYCSQSIILKETINIE